MSAPRFERLADRLVKSRTDAGFSQQELCKASGVSQQTISALESGKIGSSKGLLALAKACNVDVEWLMEGDRLTGHPGRSGQTSIGHSIIADAQARIKGIVQADILVKVAHEQLKAALGVLTQSQHPASQQLIEAIAIVEKTSAELSADSRSV
ncbi:helix-turn-helix transcriptional regulator [Pseudomonas sp. P66]|uniref:Helix-turn-helix transcriptional regulator n=1 Tax=Pseudomonas arcuscaelestis TaxID=2710591 RepID=A0ABS2BYQ5_9PSED|nr:helix-turn-helix transcriptional regulator [Pseudomonas arcuscaelestis]MBM5458737.1 helix-turn-helix transcriptional regulator [Pseudomonas arcuscaelestis]